MIDFQFFSTSSKVDRQIRDFGSLEQGWYYGVGPPICLEVIECAIRISQKMREQNPVGIVEAFPTSIGAIVVSIVRSGIVLDVTAKPNGVFDAFLEIDDEIQYDSENLSEHEANKLIEKSAWILPKFSGYFTQGPTVMRESALTAQPFSHHMMDFRWSTPLVQLPVQDANVYTLGDSTRNASRESRQFSFG